MRGGPASDYAARCSGRGPLILSLKNAAVRVLEACRKKGIGTTITKSTPVGIYHSIQSVVDRLQQQKKEIDPLHLEGLKNYKEKADRAAGD